MGLYTTNVYVPTNLLFTDGSLLHQHGNSSTIKAMGTGHLFLTDEQSFTGGSKHISTELQPYTQHNKQSECLNLVLVEMMAIVMALKQDYIQPNSKLIIYTDSEVTIKAYNNFGMSEETRAKYMKMLDLLNKTIQSKYLQVDIRWIKGHANIFGNSQADTIAKKNANKVLKTLGIPKKRKKK